MINDTIQKKQKLLAVSACLLALWCGWRACCLLSGRAYYGTAEVVYGAIPLLHTLDIACGALLACLAICLLAACTALLRRRKRLSYGLLLAALVGLMGAEILYGGFRCLLTALSPLDIAAVGRLGAYILLIIVNSSYYKACMAASSQPSGGETDEEHRADEEPEPIKQPPQAGQDPLCGGSLLPGGGGAAGDGKASA